MRRIHTIPSGSVASPLRHQGSGVAQLQWYPRDDWDVTLSVFEGTLRFDDGRQLLYKNDDLAPAGTTVAIAKTGGGLQAD